MCLFTLFRNKIEETKTFLSSLINTKCILYTLVMTELQIIKYCKDLGCCDACCLRFIGLKHPAVYEKARQNVDNLLKKCKESPPVESSGKHEVVANADNVESVSEEPCASLHTGHTSATTDDSNTNNTGVSSEVTTEDSHKNSVDNLHNGTDISVVLENGSGEPCAKRAKLSDVCVTCLGVLQENTWTHCYEMVKEVLDAKQYECDTFACALSSPLAIILRERSVALQLADAYSGYDDNIVTPLKEAWKWSFGCGLAAFLHKTLDSGAVSPLLLSVTMEYPDDLQELEVLKSVSPALFASRGRQRRRFAVEFTRRSVEQALQGATGARLRAATAPRGPAPPPGAAARCECVRAEHAPLYVGGRYVKLSRELPQTPWVLAGRRVMPSSVQERITDQLAGRCGMSAADAERRLKFMSAGREDVDVRCLGRGRPFAVEISDPRRRLNEEELRRVCEDISRDGEVLVDRLVYVTRQQLTELKRGEETKCKSYEALCVKLEHGPDDDTAAPVCVTERDVQRINTYRNTAQAHAARVALTQRTPVRVLHRRPLHARTRHILDLRAQLVPGAARLVVVRVRTEAGTYVKEWVHGELGRTRPALQHALGARADILALDVTDIELDWPPPIA